MIKYFFTFIIFVNTILSCNAVEPLELSDVIKEARKVQLEKQVLDNKKPCCEQNSSLSDNKTQDVSKQLNVAQKTIK